MIVAPIVFCVVVHGIAGAGDLKKVGRVGIKALVYFESMTTVALVVGLVLAYPFGPGHGMNIDTSTLDAKALSTYADNAQIEAHTTLRVDRRLNLGGTLICHQALLAGQMDAYPEYTGTALVAILKEPSSSDARSRL